MSSIVLVTTVVLSGVFVGAAPAAALPSNFAAKASKPGVEAVAGDFNGDDRTDVALVGGSDRVVMVAFSRGDGQFDVSITVNATLNEVANRPGVQVVAANVTGVTGGNRDDLVLVDPAAVTDTVLVARSEGNGIFSLQSRFVANFRSWDPDDFAQLVAGDVNGDGRDDLVLAGGAEWNTVRTALTQPDGSFIAVSPIVAAFPLWAQDPDAVLLAGMVNDDEFLDLVLVGPGHWTTIPVAFGTGAGTFGVTNKTNTVLPHLAGDFGTVTPLLADIDADGRSDVVLVGGDGWSFVPVGFSRGDGTFVTTAAAAPELALWADDPTAQALAGTTAVDRGDIDRGADIMLTGGAAWFTLPVGVSRGNGSFTPYNIFIS